METIMKMPIQDRKFFIQRHNREQEILKEREKNSGSGGFPTEEEWDEWLNRG